MTEALDRTSSPSDATTDSGARPEGTAWRDKPYLKYYAPWTDHELKLMDDSLVDMFHKACEEHQDEVMLDFFGGTTTYGEARQEVRRVAAALQALGGGEAR